MNKYFESVLGRIPGGRVLDVATGQGGFVEILARLLPSYQEIIGIDSSPEGLEIARKSLDQDKIRFIQMDAEHLDLEDESFDTVNISASLHHLANPTRVLAEMKRVLRPGGHMVVTEMHRDGQTEAQLTMAHLHHLVADVDLVRGVAHYHTLARQEIVDLVQDLHLFDEMLYEIYDDVSDPMDGKRIASLDALIDRQIHNARESSNHEAIRLRGEDLRQRLHTTGAQREPVIMLVGVKGRLSGY